MTDDLEQIARLAEDAGIRRVQAVAWRDLASPTAGGSEIHLQALLARFVRAGVPARLHVGAVAGHPAEVVRDGVEVRRAGGSVGAWVRGPLAVRRARRPGDVLLEVWHGLAFHAPLWAPMPSVGLFHHVHSDQFHAVLPPVAAHLAEVLERRVYPRLYRGRPMITLSESARAQMATDLGWNVDPVVVVEPGVDDRFRAGGEKDPHPLVVTVGRLMPQKHVDRAIDALALIRPHHPDLRAVVVGDGPELPALEAKVRAMGAEDWLTLAGHTSDDELLDLYQRAWVLLSASGKEGWGMTITEAAACGTPAVVSRISGHLEAVIHGTTGYLADDVAGLAEHMTTLLADPDRRARMGAAAQVHAATYGWDTAARRVMEVLAGAVRSARP